MNKRQAKKATGNGFYFGKSDISKSDLLCRGEVSLPNDELLVIGSKGSGKCHHPWDCLKPCACSCKERPVLFTKTGELYGCGEENTAIFAACLSCGRHTDTGTLSAVIENWNRDKTHEKECIKCYIRNMSKSEHQKKKVERLAAAEGITPTEYKRRCDTNTAKNKGMSLSEYSKKRLEDAAAKKNMSVTEYRKECGEHTARKKGFRNHKDYDKAGKRAKKLGITKEEYCKMLNKDTDGFYFLPKKGTETLHPRFSAGKFTDTELELIKEQEPVLQKLDEMGYGLYIKEGFYFSVPALLEDEHFPLELYCSSTKEKIVVRDWDELVMLIIKQGG